MQAPLRFKDLSPIPCVLHPDDRHLRCCQYGPCRCPSSPFSLFCPAGVKQRRTGRQPEKNPPPQSGITHHYTARLKGPADASAPRKTEGARHVSWKTTISSCMGGVSTLTGQLPTIYSHAAALLTSHLFQCFSRTAVHMSWHRCCIILGSPFHPPPNALITNKGKIQKILSTLADTSPDH